MAHEADAHEALAQEADAQEALLQEAELQEALAQEAEAQEALLLAVLAQLAESKTGAALRSGPDENLSVRGSGSAGS